MPYFYQFVFYKSDTVIGLSQTYIHIHQDKHWREAHYEVVPYW